MVLLDSRQTEREIKGRKQKYTIHNSVQYETRQDRTMKLFKGFVCTFYVSVYIKIGWNDLCRLCKSSLFPLPSMFACINVPGTLKSRDDEDDRGGRIDKRQETRVEDEDEYEDNEQEEEEGRRSLGILIKLVMHLLVKNLICSRLKSSVLSHFSGRRRRRRRREIIKTKCKT